jgi:hypothetical protein
MSLSQDFSNSTFPDYPVSCDPATNPQLPANQDSLDAAIGLADELSPSDVPQSRVTKRRGRPTKRPANSSTKDSTIEAPSTKYRRNAADKKAHVRSRNSEAAKKFRVRKRRCVEKLQEKEATAEEAHRILTTEASELREQVFELKNMVLQHGGCGCSYIEDYIEGEARTLVRDDMQN